MVENGPFCSQAIGNNRLGRRGTTPESVSSADAPAWYSFTNATHHATASLRRAARGPLRPKPRFNLGASWAGAICSPCGKHPRQILLRYKCRHLPVSPPAFQQHHHAQNPHPTNTIQGLPPRPSRTSCHLGLCLTSFQARRARRDGFCRYALKTLEHACWKNAAHPTPANKNLPSATAPIFAGAVLA